jgi:DNA-binding NtrC family response regulator
VLLVDDEEDLTWSISKSLKRDKRPLKILCTNSGDECLKLLKKYSIHLLVTDLRMPGIDGYAIIKYVEENRLPTKIIVMTAYGSSEIKESFQRRESCFYIEKPFEISTLKQKIYSILEKGECNSSTTENVFGQDQKKKQIS